MINNREGLVGDYNYAYLFTPRIPFTKNIRRTAPFFGLHDRLPVLLAFILGLQHALAMLAGGELRNIVHPSATN
jgi:NCS2 family nucleobase:cation symporter-2